MGPMAPALQDPTANLAPLALGLLALGLLLGVTVETLTASGDSLVSSASVHGLSSSGCCNFHPTNAT